MNKTAANGFKPTKCFNPARFRTIQSKLLSQIEMIDNSNHIKNANFNKNGWMNTYTSTSGNFYNSGKKQQTNQRSEYETNDIFIEESPLSKLINKAKCITTANHEKIEKARREIKTSQKDRGNTFLTGTGIYVDEQDHFQEQFKEFDEQLDPNELLKEIVREEKDDDLAELRRMIKVTGNNLDNYSRQISESSKGVINAAGHFNKQIDCTLMSKVSKLGIKDSHCKQGTFNPKRKASSVNKIHGPNFL